MRKVTLGWLVAVSLTAASVEAQGTVQPSRAYDPPPPGYGSNTGYASQQESYEPPREESFGWVEGEPVREFEIALSDESFWLGFRAPLRRGQGFFSGGVFANDDDDFLGTVKLMRFGYPEDAPLELGVGIGAYGAWLDEPGDENIYAITLSGSARYEFPTSPRTSAGVELSFAPDVTTFDDGDRLIDLMARAEVEVSSYATAFVGYRFLEVELSNGSDQELDDRIHVGIRLGF